MMTVQGMAFWTSTAGPMDRPGRAVLAGIQERGQILGVDLWQVPWQDSALSTHALEHGPGPEPSSLTPQMDRKQLDPFASRETNRASSTGDTRELDNF
jgi:hypothetical protein